VLPRLRIPLKVDGRSLSSLVCLIVCFFSLFSSIGFAQRHATRAADTIFFNGNVETIDPSFTIQQAFAVEGDQFIAVGTNRKMRALADKNTRFVDLRGATVIPGLTDNHDHVYDSAKILSRGIDMVGVTSLDEMLSRIRNRVSGADPGMTVFTTAGWRFQPAPTRRDLDRISSEIPIVVLRGRRGGAILNTAALNLAGITRDTQTYAGSKVPKDADGEPTGTNPPDYPSGMVLLDKVLPKLTEEDEENLIIQAQQKRNALGLTSVRDLSLFPEAMRAYYRVWQKGKLTLRVSLGLDIPDATNVQQMLGDWGIGPGFGDYWLRIDSLSEDPYPPVTSAKQFVTVARIVNQYNWRLSPHVDSDEALNITLDAYEEADRDKSIHDKRWIVEHIPFVTASQMDRLANLGVVVSAQYAAYAGNLEGAIRAVGKERAEKQTPMRELLDHHLIVCAGSDFVGAAETDNPFVPFYFYVTRKTKDGRVIGPEEKITRAEALRVSTVNYAYATFEEKIKGSIEPGKLADFLILSDDPLTVPEDRILLIHPVATYVGGRKVFPIQ
jgi:predicted amidohydrolase YtcJ